MSKWINLEAVFQILVFGFLIGAALPATFAVGVRLFAEGNGAVEHDGTVVTRNPVYVAVAWLLFALVAIVAITGVLFIARDFIGNMTGLYLLGAKPK